MSTRSSQLHLAVASAIALALAACGGGGGSPASTESDSFSLSGTAATGAAYPDDSSVTVTDATGASVSGTVKGGAGNYSVSLKKTAKAPFVVKVSAPDLPALVSVSTEAQPARINVTPITHLIAATLSPSGNPEKLADEIKANPATVTADRLAAKKEEVKEKYLKPVTSALGDSTDPINGNIEIGKGHDLVLEALKIQVQPLEGNVSSVSVSIKGTSASVSTTVGASAATSTLPTLTVAEALKPSDLAGDGLPAQLADLVKRMAACYALPQASRIKAGGTTAADITADECKTLFLDNDPGKYKNNSYPISSSGSFKGLFSSDPAAQGVKFTRPTFEFKVKNGNSTNASQPKDGDVVFTATATDGAGNATVLEFWARPDASGKLFLTGNLSDLDVQVSPRAELREFPNLSGKDFYNTGYTLFINSKHPYAKVVVTSPRGSSWTLYKRTGYSYFVLANKDGSLTGTSVLRLAGAFKTSATAGSPRNAFADLVWAGDADLADIDIASFAPQSAWTFDFYANATDTTPVVSGIKRRTLQRAPTLAEMKGDTWPGLVDAARTTLQKDTTAQGYIAIGGGDKLLIATGTNNDQPAWQVPAGAWSPVQVNAYGRSPDGQVSFDDSAALKPSDRKAAISCKSTGSSDTHCGPVAGNYAKDARLTALQFTGRDSRGVSVAYTVEFRK